MHAIGGRIRGDVHPPGLSWALQRGALWLKGPVRKYQIRNMLSLRFLELLDSQGFRGCYDFVYMPVNFNANWVSFGYAIVEADSSYSNSLNEGLPNSLVQVLSRIHPSPTVVNFFWIHPLASNSSQTEV